MASCCNYSTGLEQKRFVRGHCTLEYCATVVVIRRTLGKAAEKWVQKFCWKELFCASSVRTEVAHRRLLLDLHHQ